MILYNSFFKLMVLRKKSDITNPDFFLLGDVVLPTDSLVIFPPTLDKLGPSNTEPLISNYPSEINIAFNNNYNPVLGKTRPNPFNEKVLIDQYRNGHYKYNWARNVPSAIGRKRELFVENLALSKLKYRYVLDRFTPFNVSYNVLATTMDAVNHCAKDYRSREIFLKMELPRFIPSYITFENASKYYLKCFDKNGVPSAITDQAMALFKPTGDFWLMDWFLFLKGNSKASLFGKLTPAALEKLHIVFSYNGLCVIIKPGIIKGWLDEESKKGVIETPTRINGVKRLLLIFINMVKAQNANLAKSVKIEELSKFNEEEGGEEEKQETETRFLDSSVSGDVAETKQESEKEIEDISDHSSVIADILKNQPSTVREPGPTSETGAESPDESSGSATKWTDEVSESEFEQESVETAITVDNKKVTPLSGIERALENKAKTGTLTVNEKELFIKLGNKYKEIKMDNNETLDKFVVTPKDVNKEIDKPIAAKIETVLDKSMLESRTMNFKNQYAEKLMDRDVAKMVLGIQNGGVALLDMKSEEVSSIKGKFKIYTFKTHPVGGEPASRSFMIPVVNKFGAYRVDGQNRMKGIQRMDDPIRKLDDYRVGLSSYYGVKLIVSRNRLTANDRGLKMSKLIKLKKESGTKDLSYVVGKCYDPTVKTPRTHTNLARFFISIQYKDLDLQLDIKKFVDKKLTINEHIAPIGYQNGKIIYLDEYGNVTIDGKNSGTIEELLGISDEKLPIEFAQINIRGFQFPIGVVLSYLYGFDELLKILKVSYESLTYDQYRKIKSNDDLALEFADEVLVFNKRDVMSSLVFGGLAKLANIKNFNRYDLNNPTIWVSLIADNKVRPGHFNEITLMNDMFIDPIMAELLEEMGYPTVFGELLIAAVEMLKTSIHKHEIDIREQRLIGYELFPGILYNEIVNGVRQLRNKPPGSKRTFDLNPDVVMAKIVSDTATDLQSEINPIHEIKDQELLTFGGTYGRSTVSMVKRTRGHVKSYAGIVSEASKDSGKVGYLGYLTSNAKIENLRGKINVDINGGKTGVGSVTMNLAYGALRDDPKRTLFLSTQASQTTYAKDYKPTIISTSYDRLIAHRTSELYSKPAKQDGKVIKVTNDALLVKYKDGTEDSYPLGFIAGKAQGSLIKHNRVTDLKEGDSFKEGEILGWDDSYFQRDEPYNPRQVVWKGGSALRVALMENQFTFEDSISISSTFAEESKTNYIIAVEQFIDFNDAIKVHVKLGDEVDQETILCDVIDQSLANLIEDSDDRILERMGVKQVKSGSFGKVVQFLVEYNGDTALMSPSLKAFVTNADKQLKRQNDVIKNGVDSGNHAGNLNVGKEQIAPGTVKVTILIDAELNATTADKYVVGNQMKGTVGHVHRYPILTADGREISLVMSVKSIFSRMVLSLRDKMVGGELSRHIKNEFIKIYRGK